MFKFFILTLSFFIFFSSNIKAEKISITVKQASSLLTSENFKTTATVISKNSPKLSAEISGKIDRIFTNVGDVVPKGQKLIKLNCESFIQNKKAAMAALKKATSEFKYKEKQFARAKELKNKNLISDDAFDNKLNFISIAKANLKNQRAQLKLANIKVKNCIIKSPFKALVSRRILSEGDFANVGVPLIELIQLSEIEIKSEIQNNQISSLKKSKNIYFYFQEKSYIAKIRSISPIINEKNYTREVRLEFANKSAPIGAIGRIHWKNDRQFLPAEYLVKRNNNLGVFLVENSLAKFFKIPKAIEGQPVQVNLPKNAMIITEGRQLLKNGDQIKIISE